MNKVTKKCIDEVAAELKINIIDVELVLEQICKFEKQLMITNDPRYLYIMHFGTFKHNSKKQYKINLISNANKRRGNSTETEG